MQINTEQKLYVIPSGNGYTCLGFEVCQRRTNHLALELGLPAVLEIGTEQAYNTYQEYLSKASETGKRFDFDLHPKLTSLEGCRVEVKSEWDEKPRRFIVGKSTGFIPIHLEIKTKRSLGGDGISHDEPFEYVKVIWRKK